MSHSGLCFKQLKQLVTIEHVLASRGLLTQLTRRGDRLVGPCPVHGGDNANAFVVHLAKNVWHCFTRCGGGGDVVKLVRRIARTDYRGAALYLASLIDHHTTASHPVVTAPPPSTTTATFRPYTRQLRLDSTAPFLLRKGIRPDTAARFEAGLYRGRGFCAGSIAVRLHDIHGQPLGYAARRLDLGDSNRRGKWMLPPRIPKNALLYGYHRCADALRSRGVVVVECPWGVMRLAQLSLPAVALLGTHMSERQQRIIAQAPTVVVMLDADPAGADATRRLRHRLAPSTNVRTVILPKGADPDDLHDRQLLHLVNAACRSPSPTTDTSTLPLLFLS